MKTDNFLICTQTVMGDVKYQGIDNVIKFMDYYKFLEMMMPYHIQNAYQFKYNLDSFSLIFVDLSTGEWEKLTIPKRNDHSYETLLALNPSEEEKKIKEKSKLDIMWDKGKSFIFSAKRYGRVRNKTNR